MHRRTLEFGIGILCLFGSLFLVGMLLTFKVGNTDIWWHIKAGDLMRETWSSISIDPFAWTREGQPYLATHEWLSQILFSFAWQNAQAYGIMGVRFALLFFALFFPLAVNFRKTVFLSPLCVLAAVGMRASFTDRPHLWTIALLSLTVVLCIVYLESSSLRRRVLLWIFPFITLAWTNLHGAASLLGIGVFTALSLQRLVTSLMRGSLGGPEGRRELKGLVLSGIMMCVFLFVTPEGIGTLSYLPALLKDQSVSFIAEWQPSSLENYLRTVAPLLITAVISILLCRRSLIFVLTTFAAFFLLSKTAARHEALFVLVCLVLSLYMLSHVSVWERLRVRLIDHPLFSICALCVVFVVLGFRVEARSIEANRTDHLWGTGVFAPMSGAAEFIQEHGLSTKIFNSYNAGGELLFHDIPVFLDGRNLDYGYDYINVAVNAGTSRNRWNALLETYGFKTAVISYHLQAAQEPIPYVDILTSDPRWALVYLDDWSAVYVDRSSVSQDVLRDFAYTEITPKALARLSTPDEIRLGDLQNLEREVQRIAATRTDSVLAHLYLAKVYLTYGLMDAAKEHLEGAMKLRPKDPVVLQQLGNFYAAENRFADAGEAYESAIHYAGATGTTIDYNALAEIFERAGDLGKADSYRRRR